MRSRVRVCKGLELRRVIGSIVGISKRGRI